MDVRDWQARRVVGRYQPEEIYSTQREVIERQIREGVEVAIQGRHIVLEGVLVRNVTLPEAIQAAINDKLQAEQMALKMKFTIEQAQKEAEKRLVDAKGETERRKMEALAQADVERMLLRRSSSRSSSSVRRCASRPPGRPGRELTYPS